MKESETKKLSRQCKIILDSLEDGYWHSGGYIYERTKVIKYSTRISDLRLIHGYNIPQPKFRDGQFWYKLYPKQGQQSFLDNRVKKCNPYKIN